MLHRFMGSNCKGRDFIVADLHGCYEMLLDALRTVCFDPKIDRLFSVGDLADRGPQSFQCLELLLKPWFFAVLGNHEDTLLRAARDNGGSWHGCGGYLRTDGKWLTRLTQGQLSDLQSDLLPRLAALPLSIHVRSPALPFNVLHAEAAYGPFRLMSDDDLRQPLDAEARECLTWGRKLLDSPETERAWRESSEMQGLRVSPTPVQVGLSLTYVGHTIVNQPFLHRSHLFLDGGAYLGEGDSSLVLVEHGKVSSTLKVAAPDLFPLQV